MDDDLSDYFALDATTDIVILLTFRQKEAEEEARTVTALKEERCSLEMHKHTVVVRRRGAARATEIWQLQCSSELRLLLLL